MPLKTYTIDATNKVLGRLATEVATILSGKHHPDFVPYKDMGDIVIIKNVDKLKITGRKLQQKKYYHHTGYLGHLREKPLSVIMTEKPSEVLKKAVFGMLPKNKLRVNMIKRLRFE